VAALVVDRRGDGRAGRVRRGLGLGCGVLLCVLKVVLEPAMTLPDPDIRPPPPRWLGHLFGVLAILSGIGYFAWLWSIAG